MEKKKQSGYDIARKKIAQLEAEKAQLEEKYETCKYEWDVDRKAYNELVDKTMAAINALQDTRRELRAKEELIQQLCNHMGAFRRWTWNLKHSKSE